MIKAIIFDWHGVLDLTTFESVALQLAGKSKKTPDEIKQILKDVKNPVVTGKLSSETFWLFVQSELCLSDEEIKPIRKYSLAIEQNTPLWSLLSDLREKYRLGILSDCPTDKTAVIKDKVDLTVFEFAIFSSDVATSKDDSSFFTQAFRELELTPSEILYVDDTQKHIFKAESLGCKAYLFQDTNQFKSYLNHLEDKRRQSTI